MKVLRAWNFAIAIARFVADGCATVTVGQYRQRLKTCQPCEHRVGGKCLQCGCWVQIKARLPSEKCPEGKWSQDSDCFTE